MQKILIVSNYYPPEKGAAANRIEQLALQLCDNNYEVSVVCPLGNYPKGKIFEIYKGKIFVNENTKNIIIKRLWIYPSVSKNIFVRLLSTMSFATCLFFYLLFAKIPEKVVVQSPPLLLSFIAIIILSLKRKKIILNVSDLWPMAAVELNALKKGTFSHKVSLIMERFIYKKASLVLGQSNEIISHIKTIILGKKCFLYQNFPKHDTESFELNINENQSIKIFYAGLLGVAQGVLTMCEKINLQNLNVELHIFGDGAEKISIQEFIKTNSNSNIYFHGMLDRKELHAQLQLMDVAIVPLKTRIYGSVPSKIFEYTALGFPVLYFGGGEGGTIVGDYNLGWIADVGNYNDLNNQITAIAKLSKKHLFIKKQEVYTTAKDTFNLDSQMKILLEEDVF